MFEKTRDAIAQRRIRRDRTLIEYGARFAAQNDSLPVLCDNCRRYGHVLGAVVLRTADGSPARMDEHCAWEDGACFIRLAECLALAAKLRIDLKDAPRKASPIGVITVRPEYENAALIFNATSGSFTRSHIAQVGARRGK